MANQQLVTYVNGQLAAGKSREEIVAALTVTGGWSIQDVNDAFPGSVVSSPVSGVAEVVASRMIYRFIDGVILIVSLVASYWFTTVLSSNAALARMIQGKEAYIVLTPSIVIIIAVNYFRRRKTVAVAPGFAIKINDIGGTADNGSFVRLFFVTAAYSWVIAPFFCRRGGNGWRKRSRPWYFLCRTHLRLDCRPEHFRESPCGNSCFVDIVYLVSFLRDLVVPIAFSE